MNANKVLKTIEAISSGNSSDKETLGEKFARNKATDLSSDDEPLLLKSQQLKNQRSMMNGKRLRIHLLSNKAMKKKIKEKNLAAQNLSLQPLSLQDHLALPITAIQSKPQFSGGGVKS